MVAWRSRIGVGEMNDKIMAIFLAALLPGLSLAQTPHNYQCTYGDLQRRVEVLYETGVTVPCEVHYYKDTEAPGETQVLWRAMNEAGYCERMAENFIGKLKGMGWECGVGEAAGPTAAPEQGTAVESDDESEETDDTEALIPADDGKPTEE